MFSNELAFRTISLYNLSMLKSHNRLMQYKPSLPKAQIPRLFSAFENSPLSSYISVYNCSTTRGCLKNWLLFRHPRELKIKFLYINDLIFDIAKKPKETVQKLKFLDNPFAIKSVQGCTLLMMQRSRCPAFPALLQIDGTDTRREQKLTAGVSLIR